MLFPQRKAGTDMRDKKGILIVSFGTTHRDTELKCINPIEAAVKKIFNDFEVRRAFTSNMVIRKLAAKGVYIPSPLEAVEKMLEEGFTHLIVQPLLFLKGHEYHNKILDPLLSYRKKFAGFSIGEPLLSEESDFSQMADLLAILSASVNGEQIVMMGHGSSHSADSVYSVLQKRVDNKQINLKIATVEGGIGLDNILPFIKKNSGTVHLFPLMLVAGDHAKNDMAGKENSWKTTLELNGINVETHLQGMGEVMKVRQIFIKHIRACKKELFPEIYRRMREIARGEKSKIPEKLNPWFPSIDSSLCYGCGLCYVFCHRAVYGFDENNKTAFVDIPDNCTGHCSRCADLCSIRAISFPD